MPPCAPMPTSNKTAHLTAEGLRAHPVPVHEFRGQRRLAHGPAPAPVGRPGAVVAALVHGRGVAWREARPKALRWGIFHAPGRLVHRARRRIVRIIDGWPTTGLLLDSYGRIAVLT